MNPIIRRNAYLLLGLQIISLILYMATKDFLLGCGALIPWAAICLKLEGV